MSVTKDQLNDALDGLHERIERAVDVRLVRLAGRPDTLRRTVWIAVGVIVAWDLLKAALWALL